MPGQIKLMLLKPELLLHSSAKVTCVLIFSFWSASILSSV